MRACSLTNCTIVYRLLLHRKWRSLLCVTFIHRFRCNSCVIRMNFPNEMENAHIRSQPKRHREPSRQRDFLFRKYSMFAGRAKLPSPWQQLFHVSRSWACTRLSICLWRAGVGVFSERKSISSCFHMLQCSSHRQQTRHSQKRKYLLKFAKKKRGKTTTTRL